MRRAGNPREAQSAQRHGASAANRAEESVRGTEATDSEPPGQGTCTEGEHPPRGVHPVHTVEPRAGTAERPAQAAATIVCPRQATANVTALAATHHGLSDRAILVGGGGEGERHCTRSDPSRRRRRKCEWKEGRKEMRKTNVISNRA